MGEISSSNGNGHGNGNGNGVHASAHLGGDGRRKSCWYEEEIEQDLRWCFALNRSDPNVPFFFFLLFFLSGVSQARSSKAKTWDSLVFLFCEDFGVCMHVCMRGRDFKKRIF